MDDANFVGANINDFVGHADAKDDLQRAIGSLFANHKGKDREIELDLEVARLGRRRFRLTTTAALGTSELKKLVLLTILPRRQEGGDNYREVS
jgi:hypothetical protein